MQNKVVLADSEKHQKETYRIFQNEAVLAEASEREERAGKKLKRKLYAKTEVTGDL